MINSEKSRVLINDFAKDIIELVRESLLEETQNILAAKFEARQLPAARSPKRLGSPKSRVKILAEPTGPQLPTSEI